MEPVRFEGMNAVFIAPGCGDLPALRQEVDGETNIISVWKPSAEDLERLACGGCVCLSIVGGQPPVAMWTQEVKSVD